MGKTFIVERLTPAKFPGEEVWMKLAYADDEKIAHRIMMLLKSVKPRHRYRIVHENLFKGGTSKITD